MSPRLKTMKRIQTFSKRFVVAALSVLSIVTPLAVLMPQKAVAAGETYTWKDYQTISITGGDLGGSTLQMATSDPTHNMFTGTVTYKPKNCIFDADFNTIPTAGIYIIDLNQQHAGSQGGPGLCSQDIMKQFNNKQFDIAGTRSSDNNTEETADQKTVYIKVQSPKAAAESPDTVTITIKDAAGKVVGDPQKAPQSTPGWESDNITSDQRAVEYNATFSLEPGTYQVCVDNILNTCYSITKEKYKTASYTFGNTIADQTIAVTISISYRDAANATRTFGPSDVTIVKADGSGATNTIQTDSVTHEPTPDQLDSTQYADIETWLHALFKDIAPGDYKICVPDIKACKTVTKKDGESLEVNFDTNSADELTAGYDNGLGDACPKQLKSWGLQFVACPLFAAANTAINKLEEFVTGMLTTDTEGIFGSSTADGNLQQSDTSKAYYAAWNSFRLLAISLIMIVGVVMVVSEAIGLAIFDAYTIRKILPRLLIAAIFIGISWWAMKEIIQIFNNLTVWIGNLIEYPFGALNQDGKSAWTIVGQWTAILTAIVALGPFGILSYAGTVFLALMVAALTLIARRMLITFAIIGAPFFIASFVAPNTEKLGKFWRDGFIGLMLMGPIFTAMVSLGHVLAELSAKSDPFGMISLACLVLPVVAIPLVFAKLGGGGAALVGFMNDRSRGGFDRLKNYRTNELQQRGERAKNGQLFGAGLIRGKAASKLNSFTFGAGSVGSAGFKHGNPLTKAGRAQNAAALTQRRAILGAGYAKSGAGMATMVNDDLNRALTYGDESSARASMIQDFSLYNEQEGGDYTKNADGTFTYAGEGAGNYAADTERVDRAIQGVKASGGFGETRKFQAALQLAMTGTGYDNARQVTETISRVAGDNAQTAGALAGTINNVTKKAKRHDLALGVGAYVGPNGLVTKQMASNRGEGAAPTASEYRKASIGALEGVDIATFARNEHQSVDNVSRDIYDSIVESNTKAERATSEDDRQKHERNSARLTALLTRVQDNARYSSPSNIATVHANTEGADSAGLIAQIRRDSTPQTQHQATMTRQTDDSGNVSYIQTTRTVSAPAPKPHMQEETEIYVQPRPPRSNNRDRFGPAA